MHDPAAGLDVDVDLVGQLAADLHQLALRWLDTEPAAVVGPGGFGDDPTGAELSAALPVFVSRLAEARARCCALLDAASTALGAAGGALRESERAPAPPGAPR